jgi:hypothetical protein
MVRSTPFPADVTVRAALDAYLGENGFTREGYDAKWTDASVLGVRLRIPNTRRHRWGIMLHDLHHVATGYGTDLAGEGEISAWELPDAAKGGAYVGAIVTLGTLLGFAIAPVRAARALRAGRTHRRLFGRVPDRTAYDALLDGTVGALRERLGIPRGGLADRPRGLHTYAPRTAAS